MYAILPVLLLAGQAVAQLGGSWNIKVSTRDSGAAGAGCIILAQLATLSAPNTITAMKPVCPPTAPNPSPEGGQVVDWPLSEDGDGAVSDLAVYGDLPGGDGDTSKPGCVMMFTQRQVAYLWGRDLLWNSTMGAMWDNTDEGYLLDPHSFARMTWYV
jgi:hypothetical protein